MSTRKRASADVAMNACGTPRAPSCASRSKQTATNRASFPFAQAGDQLDRGGSRTTGSPHVPATAPPVGARDQIARSGSKHSSVSPSGSKAWLPLVEKQHYRGGAAGGLRTMRERGTPRPLSPAPSFCARGPSWRGAAAPRGSRRGRRGTAGRRRQAAVDGAIGRRVLAAQSLPDLNRASAPEHQGRPVRGA